MKKRLTKRLVKMLHTSLHHFPELQSKSILVGYTRANLGSATLLNNSKLNPKLTIRLNTRMPTYNTIGHELTHLVQGLSILKRSQYQTNPRNEIPAGEKQCDIWTLSRNSLFCDDAPSYLKLPQFIRENWKPFAKLVRDLCIIAIEKRKTYRFYIQWLESEIKILAQKPLVESRESEQMGLPFDS